MELDSLDRSILYSLDLDGRSSYKTLAKELHTSAEVIRYRVSRLIENRVIKRFMTLVNFSEFGHLGHGVFCKFKSEKDKSKVLDFLSSYDSIYWISEFGGTYDLAFAISAQDSIDFYKKFNEIKEKTTGTLADFDVAIRIQLIQFPRTYLLDNPPKRKNIVPYFGRELNHQKLIILIDWF